MSRKPEANMTAAKGITEQAFSVWEVMHAEAKKRGCALTRVPDHGNGRVVVGTISAFITGLSETRDWGLEKTEVDIIRRYLKKSGNVVMLDKLADYQFRIFVAEKWSEAPIMTLASGRREPTDKEKLEARIDPHDAGEDRKPAPVKHRCATCGKEFDSSLSVRGHLAVHAPREETITSRQEVLLKALYERPVSDKSGYSTRKLARRVKDRTSTMTSISGTLLAMEKKGWVTRAKKGKKTFSIAITEKGRKVAESLVENQPSAAPAQPSPPKTRATGTGETHPDDAIFLSALGRHLTDLRTQSEHSAQVSELEEKFALIASLVDDVMDGRLAPLKALADIQEALKL
jgi:DNA-binding MarR family transcriptional regulator